ncbi:unnamed protein product [Adineta ricciae]|uniref:Uncharacterized protein n=1 Tax=Adineta ricciae TaxID=249248 RepID=A0A815GXV8_ADIRI|nr:unnamed protein product [Adineta ricciae]
MPFQKMKDSTTSDIYINVEKAIVHQRIGTYSFQLEEEVVYSIVPIKDACIRSPSTNVCKFTSNAEYPNVVEISSMLPSRDELNALPRYDSNYIFDSIRSSMRKMLQLHQSLEYIAEQDHTTHLVRDQFHGIAHIQKPLQYKANNHIENDKPDIFPISSTALATVYKLIRSNKITFDFLTDAELRSFLHATISIIDKSYQIKDISESLKLFTDLIIGQSIYILRSCGGIDKQNVSNQSCLIVATSFFRPLLDNHHMLSVYQLTPLPAIVNHEQIIYSSLPRIVAIDMHDHSVMTWNTIPDKNECFMSNFMYCSKRPPLVRINWLPCLSQLLDDGRKSITSCDVTRSFNIETNTINIVDDVWLFSHDGSPILCDLQSSIEPSNTFIVINESSLLRLPCEHTLTCSDITLSSSNCISHDVLIKSPTTGEYEFMLTAPSSLQTMNKQLLPPTAPQSKTHLKTFLMTPKIMG